MARAFNGTTDDIICGLGACGFAFGPGTIAVVARRTGTGKGVVISAGASTSVAYELGVEPHASPDAGMLIDQIFLWNGTTVVGTASGMTLLASDGWCLIAVTKASGTATPRFHKYLFSDGSWTHTDASATMVNSSVPITKTSLGTNSIASGAFFAGETFIGGVWNIAMNDAQVETLSENLSSPWWLGNNGVTAPKALWVFPIVDPTVPANGIRDVTENGANQTTISGTTAVGDPLLGFSVLRQPQYLPFPPRY